ncbi:hypothetical protein L1887_11676 [Cichorium endivia]|nr:hypothetical protein L1887_11676 [Cichorium endivia]
MQSSLTTDSVQDIGLEKARVLYCRSDGGSNGLIREVASEHTPRSAGTIGTSNTMYESAVKLEEALEGG